MGRLMNIAMMRSSSMLEFLYPPHLNFWSVPARRVWRALRTCLCSGCFRSSYFFFIAIIRLRYHQPTKDYAARKTCGGKLEIIRCVKRFIAREAYRALIAIRNGGTGRRTPAERGARLRELRTGHGITQQQVGEALCVPSSRISEIERGKRDLPELERRAIQWIHSITSPKQHTQTLDNV